MATNALEIRRDYSEGALTVHDVRAQVNLIQEVMRDVMKENVHYGTIPGCQKPSLYKAGSEKLLSTFRIALEPIIEDLSTSDEARFRVIAKATSMKTGQLLGMGIGECSSCEDKYMWRRAVCPEEFDAASLNDKRMKWKRNSQGAWQEKQVRMNIADVRNTVLKMAKKRAQIDVTLTVTAASDIFEQDIEDLPEEYVAERAAQQQEQRPPVQQAQRKADAPQQASSTAETTVEKGGQAAAGRAGTAAPPPNNTAPPTNGHANGNGGGKNYVSEKQLKRFFAIYHQNGWNEEQVKDILKKRFGIEHRDQITKDKYDEICAVFEVSADAQ